MPRLFTGLEIPARVAAALSSLRGGLTGARWIDAANYHVTLRFAGDIDGRMADDFAHALDAVRPRALELTIERARCFRRDKPRALVALVGRRRSLPRSRLSMRDRSPRRHGAGDAQVHPHVTLARLRGTPAEAAAFFIASMGRFPVQRFNVSRFALFSSRASIGGGPYVVEAAYPLAGSALRPRGMRRAQRPPSPARREKDWRSG